MRFLAPLEVGHEVNPVAKAHSFVFCEPVIVTNSWQNFLASLAKKKSASEEKNTADICSVHIRHYVFRVSNNSLFTNYAQQNMIQVIEQSVQ